jgi:hypothetical protein
VIDARLSLCGRAPAFGSKIPRRHGARRDWRARDAGQPAMSSPGPQWRRRGFVMSDDKVVGVAHVGCFMSRRSVYSAAMQLDFSTLVRLLRCRLAQMRSSRSAVEQRQGTSSFASRFAAPRSRRTSPPKATGCARPTWTELALVGRARRAKSTLWIPCSPR